MTRRMDPLGHLNSPWIFGGYYDSLVGFQNTQSETLNTVNSHAELY